MFELEKYEKTIKWLHDTKNEIFNRKMNNRFIHFVLILLINGLILNCGSTLDNNIKNKDKKIQSYILSGLKSKDYPGIQYIVTSPETIIFNFNAGLADIKEQKPIDSKTTMMAYSMTKTFTAAAVLQLIDEKKISLDDSLSKFIQNNPYGNKITIRHLLSQTSGIPNPIPLKWVHLSEEDSTFNEDEVLQKILKENPNLSFPPGKKYSYSNLSYWLLGKIIEKTTGMSYREYMNKNIFQKLKLSSNEIDFIIPSDSNHAKGYLKKFSFLDLFKSFVMDSKYFGEYENGWLHLRNHYLNGSSFGGIVSSARSISVFLQDQLHDESVLFSKNAKNLFFEQQKNNTGELVEMSLGWHINSIHNVKYFYKEGGGGGFHSEMRIYPSQKIATVVIVNNTSFDVQDFLNTADQEFFKE